MIPNCQFQKPPMPNGYRLANLRSRALGIALSILASATALTLTGCSKKKAGPPGAGPAVQVVVVEAKRQPVSEILPLLGTITANEIVEIKSETDGTVQEILFDEGQRVQPGQLLLHLDESKQAASVAEAEANFKLTRSNFDRARQLLSDKLIAQQDFDQASSSFTMNEATLNLKKRQLRDARILAPFGGMVGARLVSPGQVISKNTTLTWLVDLDRVKVEFDVPERFLGQVKLGQTLQIGVAAFLDRTFKGEVYFISPFVDRELRTALVKAQIPNAHHELKPGMFANLDLTLRTRENAVVIPEVALMRDGDNVKVFVVDSQQLAQLKSVKIGEHLPGWVEVLNGLQGGELVVVEGHQKIAPGSKVKLARPESAAPYLPKETKKEKDLSHSD